MGVHAVPRVLLLLAVILCRETPVIAACSASPGLLLCGSCGQRVASGEHAQLAPSPLALSRRNDTVLGGRRVTAQLVENPEGLRFEVLAFTRAEVMKHWPAEERFTWFPGFSWTVATCPGCGAHLGWGFQPSEWPETVTDEEFEASDRTFVTLIADRLLQEDFASTLPTTPKSFKS